MSDVELKFPAWQAPLQELILEADDEKFLEKLQEVERLISERRQQLDHNGDGASERLAIDDAVALLGLISRDKIVSPDGK